jgi:hypothetical protein
LVGQFSGEPIFWRANFLESQFSGEPIFWRANFLESQFSGEPIFISFNLTGSYKETKISSLEEIRMTDKAEFRHQKKLGAILGWGGGSQLIARGFSTG